MKELVSPKQVAHAIGVSEASLKRWCDKGLLPMVRTAGGHRRIPINGVIQFLRSRGHQIVRPDVLGLPSTIGTGPVAIERAAARMIAALEAGDEALVRRLVLNLYMEGHPAHDICDRVLAPTFHALGDRWQHGELEVYQERRGCEIALRALHEVRMALPAPPAHAPRAVCATLAPDIYSLPLTMVELALREVGWRADSYGTGHPAATLSAAIENVQPRLFCLSVSYVPASDEFLAGYARLHETAARCGTAIAVGGRALDEPLRRAMSYAAYCDTLRHLVDFANALNPASS